MPCTIKFCTSRDGNRKRGKTIIKYTTKTNKGKRSFAKLAIVITAIMLTLSAMSLIVSNVTSGIASASEMPLSFDVVTQSTSDVIKLSETKIELDVSASNYKHQLQDAGIDSDIDPLDYGMPAGARLATRMTNTYYMHYKEDASDTWTFWSEVSVYITTSSWRHGFLWQSVSSDTTATIMAVAHGLSISTGSVRVSSTNVSIKLQAGDRQGGYDTFHTANNFTDYKKSYGDNEDKPYGRIEGGDWTHSAHIKWHVRLSVIDLNGQTNIFPYVNELRIFTE